MVSPTLMPALAPFPETAYSPRVGEGGGWGVDSCQYHRLLDDGRPGCGAHVQRTFTTRPPPEASDSASLRPRGLSTSTWTTQKGGGGRTAFRQEAETD